MPTRIAARNGLAVVVFLALMVASQVGRITAGTDSIAASADRVRVTSGAAQPVVSGTNAALAWSAETYDDADLHSPVNGTERLTARKPGTYQMSCAAEWPNLGGAVAVSTLLRVNGTTVIARQQTAAVSGGPTIVAVATGYRLAAADYVECLVFHQAGRTVSVQPGHTFFEMSRSSS
jgi:hypothetical protein